MSFLNDTNIWLVLSFAGFLFIVWRYGKNAFLNMLDERIEKIRQELDEAENLRTEAQELLAQYQRKHRDAMQDAELIIQNAKAQADHLLKEAEANLEETARRREQRLEERLKNMKVSAIREMQDYASNLAVQATYEIIHDRMDKKLQATLSDQSIKNIKQSIH